jgi:glutamyl-tRNA synthetase
MTTIRTRIAPSPTGYPHIGTVYQALFDYVYARQNQGKFIIRIEDTDQSRKVEDAEAVIYQALEYYGLSPDEGPEYGGDYGPYRQSERLEIYQQHAQSLIDAGHAYYCFCSPDRLAQVRQQLQKEGKPPMYDQYCRHLQVEEAKARAQNEAHVIRMKVPAGELISFTDVIRGKIEFNSNLVDDQVILKSDGYPTYHLAVVVDDQLMQISHIVRGEEWISSTPKHVLLYRYFGWKMPPLIHMPLLRNPDRSKISKRHGHTSAFWYREQGYLIEAVINFLATRVWNHPEGLEVFGIDEMIKHFKFEDLHIQGPIVDLDKLNWLNGQWIRRQSDHELLELLKPYRPEQLNDDLLKRILPLIKDRLVILSDITSLSEFFYAAPKLTVEELTKQSKISAEETASYLRKVEEMFEAIDTWNVEALETQSRKLQADLHLKPRPAFMTIRLAVTGKIATPPLFDVLEVLGKENTLSRLQSARELLLKA